MYHQYFKGFIISFQRKAIFSNWRKDDTNPFTVWTKVSIPCLKHYFRIYSFQSIHLRWNILLAGTRLNSRSVCQEWDTLTESSTNFLKTSIGGDFGSNLYYTQSYSIPNFNQVIHIQWEQPFSTLWAKHSTATTTSNYKSTVVDRFSRKISPRKIFY